MTRLTQEEFIRRCKLVHGDKYDYSLVDYKNSHIKIKIICHEHGEFEQLPYQHLNGFGCSKCSGTKKYTVIEFIEKSNKVHENFYFYSKVIYKNNRTKVIITCPIHGDFKQTPDSHLSGRRCLKCSGVYKKTTSEFIELSKTIHQDKYDYSKVDYKNAHDKIIIICKKHGEFLCEPSDHLYGAGCPKCNFSKGEIKTRNILIFNNIEFEEQKTFEKCRYKQPLKFDFYLPKYNTCIEYDGEQHFVICERFGGVDELNKVKIRDKIKTTFCEKNGIFLLRISYKENIEERLQWLMNYLKILPKKLS